jgi:uroporphyrinogen III methyltransferase/synthase
MARKLEHLGAVVSRLSAVEIREPADFAPVDRALDQLRAGEWDWLVFTSANGVHALLRRLDAVGRDLRDLGRVKIAVIGPKTADALREYRLRADLVPGATYSSEGLAAALAPHVAGKRVLLARANRGRELLRDALTRTAARVEQVVVYDQVDAVDADDAVLDALRRGEIRYVTLPSSNIARGLLAAFDETVRGRVERGEIRLVAISPETGNAVRELGYPVAAEAEVFTEDGLIDAVIRLAQSEPGH